MDFSEDSVIEPFLRANMAEVKNMCLTEYDEAYEREFLIKENRREGWKEGLAEGRALEAKRMGALISRLIKENRITDADKAAIDSGYREKLYKEFNI